MANGNKPNNNGSQFFITLDQCPWLDKKHTIFGKVVGDTLYNLMAMGDEDVDENERPLNPPRIKSCEVILNPFDDIFPRDLPKRAAATTAPSKTAVKPKVKKPVEYLFFVCVCVAATAGQNSPSKISNMNLLSFADTEDFGAPPAPQKAAAAAAPPKKILSSHDALNDPSLSKEYAVPPEVLAKEREKLRLAEERKEKLKQEISEKKASAAPIATKGAEIPAPAATSAEPVADEKAKYAKFDEKMKTMLLKKRKLMDDVKKISEEEIDKAAGGGEKGDDDESPVVKGGDKKKTARGFVQKTRGVGLEDESKESQSGESASEDDEFLTVEQKYEIFISHPNS